MGHDVPFLGVHPQGYPNEHGSELVQMYRALPGVTNNGALGS
jgi:hypothetical protein